MAYDVFNTDVHVVSSYWATLRKRRDTVNLKSTHWIALCEELTFREAVDLSYDYGSHEYKHNIKLMLEAETPRRVKHHTARNKYRHSSVKRK